MKLYFTNVYRPRFDQISRIMKFLLLQEGKNKITIKEIVNVLGIPKKQVSYLISMMVGFGLLEPRATTLTDLGEIIIENDQFFEKKNHFE